MILFPNCKINLGLRVTGKRTDGYHNIETVFYPLPLKDAAELTIVPKAEHRLTAKYAGNDFELNISGMAVPGNIEDNLCHKAWEIIKNDFPDIIPGRMHLLKAIPIGAGLGGGSSDGACTLLLLNHELNLNIPSEKLMEYALQLGSDCPFFILNKPCYATGRGEQMKEAALNLNDYYFVLVVSDVHISTAWAFGKISPTKIVHKKSLMEIVSLPVEQWKDHLINDFEEYVFNEYKSLKLIKNQLYEAGAVYASLTGTGSCIFGIFNKKTNPRLHKISDYYKLYNLK